MEELVFFADYLNLIVLFILTFVIGFLWLTVFPSFKNKQFLRFNFLERVWTVLPTLILLQLVIPSLALLYTLDDTSDSNLSIKAVGHQWYWSYEIWDNRVSGPVEITSYIRQAGGLRLLDTDNRMVLPLDSLVQTLVTTSDVLHAFTLPCLGVKVDAVPGRLNQCILASLRPAVVFGQCSEICGANHRFMPLRFEFVSEDDWVSWMFVSSQEA